MKEKTEQLITASFIYEEIILSVEETTSGGRCGSSLAAFHALRQPVQVTWCRRAFFYLWKGVKEYEPEIHLPRLWDLLGL